MSGVTRLDRIRNERIRGTTKVGEISKKVQESKLKCYGRVLSREDEYVGKRVMVMEVPGERYIDPHIKVGKYAEEVEVLPYAISKYFSEQVIKQSVSAS